MPQIPDFGDRLAPQGFVQAQATPNDFGAQVGQGLQALGSGAEGLVTGVEQHYVNQDVTNIHVQMAQARAQWTEALKTREMQAKPGDDTFAPTLQKDMQEWLDKGSGIAQTVQGKRLYAQQAASLSSEFFDKALGVQVELAAKGAQNLYQKLDLAFGDAAYADETQTASIKAQAQAAINDPNSIFAKVPQTTRDQMLKQLQNNIDYAAAKGYVRRAPSSVLDSVAPGQLVKFSAWQSQIKALEVPGGQAKISPGTMEQAPTIIPEATAHGLNSNIIMAQVDQHAPGTDSKAVISDMSVLLKTYGGDYSKALSAYYLGTPTFNGLLKSAGNDWQAMLPPAAATYTQTVLANAGQVSRPAGLVPQPAVDPTAVQPGMTANSPVYSSLPFFHNLSWEQQDHVIKEGVQLANFERMMTIRDRNEQEFQRKQASDQAMDGYIKQIIDPKQFGKLDLNAVTNDQALTWQDRQHLAEYQLSRARELLADAQSKTNPFEVRRLMLQIHAADDDPTKTYNMDPVMESYKLGRISTSEMQMLRGEVEQMKDGNTNGFGRRANQMAEVAHDALVRSPLGQAMPAEAANAYYNFLNDMQAQIAAKRKANEDPGTLLDPNSRDFLLKPGRLDSFMKNARQAVRQGAENAKAGLPTFKQYDQLEKGASYTDDKGNIRIKQEAKKAAVPEAPSIDLSTVD